jgi:tyrosyl-tRNA synthetase
MSSVYDTLVERGFVTQCSDEAAVRELLSTRRVTGYIGFDPSADSLHLGSLVPMMALKQFQRAGHRVVAVVGGATGMIGDPSGRSEERSLLDPDRLAANVAGVHRLLERFLDEPGNPPAMVNNADWIGPMSFIDWLRDVGKHFTVNYMLGKDSVQSRLVAEQGISYTEFSYMTLQAYDFLHLFDAQGCLLQAGGSDQWGNITAGIELIRKLRGASAYGLTFPLLTTAAGEKFGKSAGNAIWLDRGRTRPWDMYQFLVRQDDRDVVKMLKLLTFLPLERIGELAESLTSNPGKREPHRALAFEVTSQIHGREVAAELERAAETIYYSEIRDLSDETLGAVFADVPSVEVSRAELEQGIALVDLLVRSSLAPSRGAARRLLDQGGVYVNNLRVEPTTMVGLGHRASESFLVLRAGKKSQCLVRVA